MVRAPWLWSCLALAGCSLSLDGPAKDRRLSERPVCDTSKGSVALDGIVGTGLGIGALAAVDEGSTGAAALFGVVGGLYILSAVSGSHTVDACNDAIASFEAVHQAPVGGRIAREQAAPALLSETPHVAHPPRATDDEVPPDDMSPELISQTPHLAPAAGLPPPVVVRSPAPAAPPPAPRPGERWDQFWKETP